MGHWGHLARSLLAFLECGPRQQPRQPLGYHRARRVFLRAPQRQPSKDFTPRIRLAYDRQCPHTTQPMLMTAYS